MQIILLDDIPKLGNTGDLVKVKPGFARNYLLPRHKAVLASEHNRKALEHQQREAQKKRERLKAGALEIATKINHAIVTISKKIGDNDKLFGSVTSQDLERALTAQGIEVDRRKIILHHPIRELGIYKIEIKLHADVAAFFQVWVIAEA